MVLIINKYSRYLWLSVFTVFCILSGCKCLEEKTFYSDGTVKSKFFYYLAQDGSVVKNGNAVTYSKDGKIKKIEHFKDGQLEGIVEHISPNYKQVFIFEQNEPKSLVTYNKNGDEISSCYIENGQLNGSQWIPLKGNKISFFKSGKIVREAECDNNGIKHGVSLQFNKSGNIISVINFKNGIKDGKFFEYYAGKKIKTKGYYLNGKKSGKWISYNQDGVVHSTINHTPVLPKKIEK